MADLLTELTAASTRLSAALHPRTAASLTELVRVMNCYYSNLIEGHNTRPRDIERALANDLESEPERRNLQLEARAHIRVQREVDLHHLSGKLPEPSSPGFIRWLHREFYRDAPPELLTIEGAGRKISMVAGEWRSRTEHDVAVGRHIPPSSDQVEPFMEYFAKRFHSDALSPSLRLIAIASAHHRFNFIHPFPDGNGRVGRLMSHAMGLAWGVGAHGLWSISRGLARGLKSRTEYKTMMDLADTPRENDLDGRGNLSLRCLNKFVTWFLQVCLDQLKFMAQFELRNLRERIGIHAARTGIRVEGVRLLQELTVRGEIPRGEAHWITGMSVRATRDIVGGLQQAQRLRSETPKGPIRLHVAVDAAEALFPLLFPST